VAGDNAVSVTSREAGDEHVEQEPGFKPWSGTKEEHLRRIEAETQALGRLPGTGEVAWIHDPLA
jgi:hypothetical protein